MVKKEGEDALLTLLVDNALKRCTFAIFPEALSFREDEQSLPTTLSMSFSSG